MKPAIKDLSKLSDDRLFEEISKGISLIIKNAESWDDIARNLVKEGKYHGVKLCRCLVEEESAKILILIDAVRCPRECQFSTLEFFYDHLAKGIYAKACEWRTPNFEMMSKYIERERHSWYLDGPKDVDWIFRNSIQATREQAMYVDYVQDITEEDGEHFWISPSSSYQETLYYTPISLDVARAIVWMKATTPKGLSITAETWRSFEPKPETTIQELNWFKNKMIKRLKEERLCLDLEDREIHESIFNWPFPLWSFDLKSKKTDIKELRNERKKYNMWLKETESKRDPKPIISRRKIEKLSNTFFIWDQEMKSMIDDFHRNKNKDKKFRTLHSSLFVQFHDLNSYKNLERMLRELSRDERMDLAALAWFGEFNVADWPYHHQHARTVIGSDYKYESGLGRHWLTGLERYEKNGE